MGQISPSYLREAKPRGVQSKQVWPKWNSSPRQKEIIWYFSMTQSLFIQYMIWQKRKKKNNHYVKNEGKGYLYSHNSPDLPFMHVIIVYPIIVWYFGICARCWWTRWHKQTNKLTERRRDIISRDFIYKACNCHLPESKLDW